MTIYRYKDNKNDKNMPLTMIDYDYNFCIP